MTLENLETIPGSRVFLEELAITEQDGQVLKTIRSQLDLELQLRTTRVKPPGASDIDPERVAKMDLLGIVPLELGLMELHLPELLQ